MCVMCLYRELNVDVIEYYVGTVVVGYSSHLHRTFATLCFCRQTALESPNVTQGREGTEKHR